MTKKESTYTIKIIGSKEDVNEATISFEKRIGIDGIKRMTGIKPSSDPDQYFRFIEAYSGATKNVIIDKPQGHLSKIMGKITGKQTNKEE